MIGGNIMVTLDSVILDDWLQIALFTEQVSQPQYAIGDFENKEYTIIYPRKHIQTVYGNTYVGAGHTVGSTKNVIWTTNVTQDVVGDKYVEMTFISSQKDDSGYKFNITIILLFDNKCQQVVSSQQWPEQC